LISRFAGALAEAPADPPSPSELSDSLSAADTGGPALAEEDEEDDDDEEDDEEEEEGADDADEDEEDAEEEAIRDDLRLPTETFSGVIGT
jgi:hypothetical protein